MIQLPLIPEGSETAHSVLPSCPLHTNSLHRSSTTFKHEAAQEQDMQQQSRCNAGIVREGSSKSSDPQARVVLSMTGDCGIYQVLAASTQELTRHFDLPLPA